MTQSKLNDSNKQHDQSIMQMMDKVNKPLLIATFLLSIFLAFVGADLATNFGFSKLIPTALLAIAVAGVFTQLFVNAARTDTAARVVISPKAQ